jgi:hypothetical protein
LRSGSARRTAATIAIAAIVGVAATTRVSAHRLDELLQAARIGIGETQVEVELDLTPGLAIADAWLAAIDRDGDGTLSAPEQGAYVATLLAEIEMTADTTPLRLEPARVTFPAADALRRGEGVIAVRAHATLPRPETGEHRLVFKNGHRRRESVYLANALVPSSDRIAVTGQRRDGEQTVLTIDYRLVESQPAALPFVILTVAVAVTAAVARKSRFE